MEPVVYMMCIQTLVAIVMLFIARKSNETSIHIRTTVDLIDRRDRVRRVEREVLLLTHRLYLSLRNALFEAKTMNVFGQKGKKEITSEHFDETIPNKCYFRRKGSKLEGDTTKILNHIAFCESEFCESKDIVWAFQRFKKALEPFRISSNPNARYVSIHNYNLQNIGSAIENLRTHLNLFKERKVK